MNSIDRKILAELQADGRLSITELAERVNLSLSPCHRRLRALEQEGVITGYRANLDPGKMGFNFVALVFATLVGLLSGLYPSLRAATLVPVTALKYE